MSFFATTLKYWFDIANERKKELTTLRTKSTTGALSNRDSARSSRSSQDEEEKVMVTSTEALLNYTKIHNKVLKLEARASIRDLAEFTKKEKVSQVIQQKQELLVKAIAELKEENNTLYDEMSKTETFKKQHMGLEKKYKQLKAAFLASKLDQETLVKKVLILSKKNKEVDGYKVLKSGTNPEEENPPAELLSETLKFEPSSSELLNESMYPLTHRSETSSIDLNMSMDSLGTPRDKTQIYRNYSLLAGSFSSLFRY